MDKKTMIEKITNLLKEIGHAWVSGKCGNYNYIKYDGGNVYLLSDWGNSTKYTRLGKLGEKKIEIIYNGLKNHFVMWQI